MTKTSRRRLLIETTIACLAACIVALPGAVARGQPGSQSTTNGWMGGLHYGVPLKWSVAIGHVLPGSYDNWQPFIAAEPGIGGWRAGVGALRMTNELGGAYFARASVLHTDSKAWRAPSHATYVGPEFQFMPIFAIGARVGGFFRVAGKGASRGLLTADLSVLF
jgi:hypothetical protein